MGFALLKENIFVLKKPAIINRPKLITPVVIMIKYDDLGRLQVWRAKESYIIVTPKGAFAPLPAFVKQYVPQSGNFNSTTPGSYSTTITNYNSVSMQVWGASGGGGGASAAGAGSAGTSGGQSSITWGSISLIASGGGGGAQGVGAYARGADGAPGSTSGPTGYTGGTGFAGGSAGHADYNSGAYTDGGTGGAGGYAAINFKYGDVNAPIPNTTLSGVVGTKGNGGGTVANFRAIQGGVGHDGQFTVGWS